MATQIKKAHDTANIIGNWKGISTLIEPPFLYLNIHLISSI